MIPVALQQNNQRGYGYPFCLLPEKLVDVIRFVELETQAPSEMIAASLLGVMSQACQDVFDVAPNEKLRFPVSLYQIIVAESGERKSAVDKIIMRSIRELEDELEIKYRDQRNEYEKNSRLWVVKSRALEKVIKAAVSKGSDTSGYEIQYKELYDSKPIPPIFRRLLINDATRAAVKKGLGMGWPSFALVSDESGSILQSELLRDTPLLNAVWGDCSINVERANSDFFSIKDARFGLMLMVQPGVFKEYVKVQGPQARASGFFARCLISQPRSNIGNRFNDENHHTIMSSITEAHRPSVDVIEWFNKRVRELFLQGFNRREEGVARICLTLSAEARAMWVSEYNRVEAQCRDSGTLRDYKDYASKQLEHVTRIAAVIEGFSSGGTTISAKTMNAASEIAKWYFESFIELMEVLPQEVVDAKLLESWLGSNMTKTENGFFYKNHVLQYGPASLRNRQRLNAAIDVLYSQYKVAKFQHGKKECISYNPCGNVGSLIGSLYVRQ